METKDVTYTNDLPNLTLEVGKMDRDQIQCKDEKKTFKLEKKDVLHVETPNK